MRKKPRKVAGWEWRPFLAKMLTGQGAAISTLITLRTTDPWLWGNCIFIAVAIAMGVDTITWVTSEPREN